MVEDVVDIIRERTEAMRLPAQEPAPERQMCKQCKYDHRGIWRRHP
jgi:hypothetical protein